MRVFNKWSVRHMYEDRAANVVYMIPANGCLEVPDTVGRMLIDAHPTKLCDADADEPPRLDEPGQTDGHDAEARSANETPGSQPEEAPSALPDRQRGLWRPPGVGASTRRLRDQARTRAGGPIAAALVRTRQAARAPRPP